MNPVQEPVTVQVAAVQETVQAANVQTPVTVQASPAKDLPPSSIFTFPPTVEASSLKTKRKRPRIQFLVKVTACLQMSSLQVLSRSGQLILY